MKKIFGLTAIFLFTAWAQAASYALPSNGSRIVGQPKSAVTKRGDTLNRLAVRHGVGYNEMVKANKRWRGRKIPAGTKVVVPTQHRLPDAAQRGIVINLADMRLYYYPPGKNKVVTFPVAIGKRGWRTPQGRTKVISKRKNPTWTPPASIRKASARKGKKLKKVYPAGPNNPLGTRAMRLGLPGYLIHGTNKPYSIGKRISHGCIRLRRRDIERLYSMVPVNTPVRIVNQASHLRFKQPQQYQDTISPSEYRMVVEKPTDSAPEPQLSQQPRPKNREVIERRKLTSLPAEARPVRSSTEFHPGDSYLADDFDMNQLQRDIDSGAVNPLDLSDL